MEFILGGDDDEFARDVDSGELDLVFASDSAPADQVARYQQDPELGGRVFLDTGEVAYYVSMNLAAPPFDDIHVRRAVNLAIDKTPLIEAVSHPPFGPFGISSAEIATHIGSDGVEGSLLPGFDPYPHDRAAARREMRLSVVRPYRGRSVRRTSLSGSSHHRNTVRYCPRSGARDPRRPRRPRHRARTRSGTQSLLLAALRSFPKDPDRYRWRLGEGLPERLGLVPAAVRSRQPRIVEPLAARRDRRSAPRMGILRDVGSRASRTDWRRVRPAGARARPSAGRSSTSTS